MIDPRQTLRRIALVSIAIGSAAVVSHTSISTMLVERGDVEMLAGSPRASALYRRALWFDERNIVAADRLVFAAVLSHRRPQLLDGMRIADRFLSRDPANATLMMDRALCEQLLHRYGAAASDFAAVGASMHDARALLFAADDNARLKKKAPAFSELALALHFDGRFIPARYAMRRLAAR